MKKWTAALLTGWVLMVPYSGAETWTGTLAGRPVECSSVQNYLNDRVRDFATHFSATCTKLVGRKKALLVFPPAHPDARLSRLCRRWKPSRFYAFGRLRGPCCKVSVDSMTFDDHVGVALAATVTCHRRVIGDLRLGRSVP